MSFENQLFYLCCGVVTIGTYVGLWGVFVKFGEPGWKALVPVYNNLIFAKYVFGHWAWGLISFIPLVNCCYYPIAMVSLGRTFGKSENFCLGLFFLPFIFTFVLARDLLADYIAPIETFKGKLKIKKKQGVGEVPIQDSSKPLSVFCENCGEKLEPQLGYCKKCGKPR